MLELKVGAIYYSKDFNDYINIEKIMPKMVDCYDPYRTKRMGSSYSKWYRVKKEDLIITLEIGSYVEVKSFDVDRNNPK